MPEENERPFTFAKIKTKVPADPAERVKFTRVLEAVAAIFPVDDVEPLRSDVLDQAAARLIIEGVDLFDEQDGTDWADVLADAYFAARANYAARSNPSGGNA